MDLVRALARHATPLGGRTRQAEARTWSRACAALLDGTRQPSPVEPAGAIVIAGGGNGGAAAEVVAITAQAQAARGSLVGVVEDASHARIPNCQVNAKKPGRHQPGRCTARQCFRAEYSLRGHSAGDATRLEFRSAGSRPSKSGTRRMEAGIKRVRVRMPPR